MILVPDELQADLYKAEIAPNLRDGAPSPSPMGSPSISR